MSMWINLNHYCLNMQLCRRLLSRSIHSCSRDGKIFVIRCSTSLGPLGWTPEFAVLNRLYWQDVSFFAYLAFEVAPKEILCYRKIGERVDQAISQNKKRLFPVWQCNALHRQSLYNTPHCQRHRHQTTPWKAIAKHTVTSQISFGEFRACSKCA
jgi:hypothetical protein